MSRFLAIGLVVAIAACQPGVPTNRLVTSVADSVPSSRLPDTARTTIFAPVGPVAENGAPPAFARKSVAIGGSYALGRADAPIVVIEFADFECPFCARSHARFTPVRDDLVSKGVLRWIFLDFPLPMHERAMPAAAFARCAAEHGKPADFWRAHDALFERQTVWSNALDLETSFGRLAADVGLSPETVECARSTEQQAFLQAAFEQGREIGIPGTPSIFVNGLPFGSQLEPPVLKRVVEDLQKMSAETILREQGIQLVTEDATSGK